VLLVTMSVVAVAAIAFALRETRVRGDLIPVYLLAGAAIAIFYEPLGDFLVLAFYPARNQIGWIQMFGHKVPAFIEVLYFWYFCPFVLVFMRLARRGFTARTWWGLWLGTLAFCEAFEILGLHLNTWLYYGPQPLVVAKLPVWVPFTYVSFLFAISAGVYGISKLLGRRHHWLVIPATPLLLAASHAATSFPAASALYSTTNKTVLVLAAIGSMAAAVVLAYGLWLPLRRRQPVAATNGARPTQAPAPPVLAGRL
jgi:hypothetical protein